MNLELIIFTLLRTTCLCARPHLHMRSVPLIHLALSLQKCAVLGPACAGSTMYMTDSIAIFVTVLCEHELWKCT